MRSFRSFATQRDKNRERFARWRARKEAIRLDLRKDEPIRGEWRGTHVFTIVCEDHLSGTSQKLDFYLSNKRINSYRVTLNGQPWRQQISATETLVWLRKQLPRFGLHE